MYIHHSVLFYAYRYQIYKNYKESRATMKVKLTLTLIKSNITFLLYMICQEQCQFSRLSGLHKLVKQHTDTGKKCQNPGIIWVDCKTGINLTTAATEPPRELTVWYSSGMVAVGGGKEHIIIHHLFMSVGATEKPKSLINFMSCDFNYYCVLLLRSPLLMEAPMQYCITNTGCTMC